MGKMKGLLMEVQENGVSTMSQYLALRNMVIGKAMVTMNDRKRIQLRGFTRRDFEVVCLHIQKGMGIKVVTPVHERTEWRAGKMIRYDVPGWNMVSHDRIHSALQTLVRQGYLTYEVINGTFVYHLTDKNQF